MKKILAVVVGVIAVVAILVGVAASQSGSIIRHAVEEFGPDITGTSVVLSDVDVSLIAGTASIKNLVIGNPEGFKSDSAVRVGEVAVLLDIKSLFSDRIHVKRILVDAAELTYELGNGGSNINVLQRNIEQRTAALAGEEAAPGDGDQESPTTLMIDDVFVNGTRVNLVASLLGGKGAGVTLPDLHLEDIGQEGDGASPADAVKEVFGAVTKSVGVNVTKVLPTDQIKGAVDKAVEEKLKGVGGKLKGLFGK